MSSDPSKKYDIILYGATGFTGKLVINYIKSQLHRDGLNLKFAIAGRNEQRLKDALASGNWPKGEPVDILIADTSNYDSICTLAKSAKVIIDTAGPFFLHGEPVVRACIEHHAHYLDITGEPGYVRTLIESYDKDARTKGVAIVPCCGYDSIPPDLTTFLAMSKLSPEDLTTSEVSVEVFSQIKNGSASSGTLRTALEGVSGNARSVTLNHATKYPHYSREMSTWVVPAPTSDIVILHRTQELLANPSLDFKASHSTPYPLAIKASVYICFQKFRSILLVILGILVVIFIAKLIPGGKSFLDSKIPAGNGPSAVTRAKTTFKATAIAEVKHPKDKTSRRIVTQMSGGDGGYTQTAMFITECAILLATELDQIPIAKAGGVLTPASAFGFKLVDKLKKYVGITFQDLE